MLAKFFDKIRHDSATNGYIAPNPCPAGDHDQAVWFPTRSAALRWLRARVGAINTHGEAAKTFAEKVIENMEVVRCPHGFSTTWIYAAGIYRDCVDSLRNEVFGIAYREQLSALIEANS